MIFKPSKRKIFSDIYDQYVEKIYRFVFLKVNSQEIAQDLTSETFLRFWKKLETLNSPTKIENPKAFLYQIARNLIIDHYREKNKVQLISPEKLVLDDPNTNLEKEVLLASEIKEVQKALSNLKEEYQDLIIWYYLDELSIREIAEILDKSEKSIRVQLYRALKSLREIMNLEN